MATTDYVTGTVVTRDWLNDADALIYEGNWPATVVPKTDTISEETTGAGVTIDGVQCKDSTVVMGSPFNFRNKIINGNFYFWQRGTSFTTITTGFYSADRFLHGHVGSTQTISRQAFTLGQTDVPGEPSYFIRNVVTSSAGAGNYAQLIQRIESVRTLAGKTAVLTFYAKADAAKNIAVELAQSFGTGGSPSTSVTNITPVTCSLTTSWQKFTATFTIPSISGKTLGTNNNDSLILIIWFDAGSSYNSRTNTLGQQSGTFDIARVQLEEGSVATPFEERPFATELALCYRYYERNPIYLVSPAAYPGGSGGLCKAIINVGASPATLMLGMDFKVTKRALPVVSARYDIADGTDTDAAVNIITLGGFTTFTNGVPAGQRLDLNDWQADAEL